MNAVARKYAALPPAPAELQTALRGALDVAFTLTTPDAIVFGPVAAAGAAAPAAPSLSGQPVARVESGSARVAVLVLHAEPWRQRVLRRIGPLLAEFSVNADLQTQRDLADEAALGRPVTAQWLAAGTAAYDPLGRGRTLATHAAALLARGYKPGDAELAGRRVQALIELDDARNRIATDPVGAELALARVLDQIADYAFAAAGRWLPPQAERRSALGDVDRTSALLLEGCFQAFDVAARLRATERVADRVLGMRAAPDWIGPRLPAATSGL